MLAWCPAALIFMSDIGDFLLDNVLPNVYLQSWKLVQGKILSNFGGVGISMEGEIRPQISWTANKVVLLQKVMNYPVNNYRFGHQNELYICWNDHEVTAITFPELKVIPPFKDRTQCFCMLFLKLHFFLFHLLIQNGYRYHWKT